MRDPDDALEGRDELRRAARLSPPADEQAIDRAVAADLPDHDVYVRGLFVDGDSGAPQLELGRSTL